MAYLAYQYVFVFDVYNRLTKANSNFSVQVFTNYEIIKNKKPIIFSLHVQLYMIYWLLLVLNQTGQVDMTRIQSDNESPTDISKIIFCVFNRYV